MTYIIPNQETKKIKQLNINDLLGDIYSSKNIDLSEEGYIKLSHKPVAVMTKDDDADFSGADSMGKSSSELFINASHLFSGGVGLNTFTDRATDTNAPSGSVEEDIIYFNATEVASDGANIKYRSAPTVWTTVSLSLNTSNPTQMAVFDAFNSLLVGNLNRVIMVDTSWVAGVILTLPAQYQVTSLAVSNNQVAIGTRHIAGGEAKLFIWDGTSSAHNGSFGVKTYEIPAVRSYKSSFALVTSLGQLLQFNGGGFEELGVLPVYYFKINWSDAQNDHSQISNRGMVVDGEDIYIRLDSDCSANTRRRFNHYFQGGVWRYNPSSGLNCVFTPSSTKFLHDGIDTTDVNTTTNVITVASAPITGTPCQYDDGSSTVMGGLKDNAIYYVIKVDATHIKLATTFANAIAGTAIDLTGTGSNFQSLDFFLITDYGWSYASNRGSVEVISDLLSSNSYTTDKYVFSALLFEKQATTTMCVFNIVHPLLPNNGYFITPKLISPNAQDKYDMIYLKYRPLNTDDKINIKYRTINRLGLPLGSFDKVSNVSGVWSDTNTFTTTVDMANAMVGDEVEFVAGVGAGWTAHIESISENAGTYTVNLDDSFIFASANDIMYFVVDNWKRLKTITSSTEKGKDFDEIGFDETSKFLQFKIELYGLDVTIEELQVKNKKSKG